LRAVDDMGLLGSVAGSVATEKVGVATFVVTGR
jgi:hypothetical protein